MNQRIKTTYRTTPKEKDLHKEVLLSRFDQTISDLTCLSVLTHPGFWSQADKKQWNTLRNSIIDIVAAVIDLKQMANELNVEEHVVNHDAVGDYARRHAKGDPTGNCAKAVRMALQHGGVPLSNWPKVAKDYREYLPQYGYQVIEPSNYDEPQVGDIVVLEPHPGGHPAGHIAVFDGTNWVSDFVQRDHWGGPGWRNNETEHCFLRMT